MEEGVRGVMTPASSVSGMKGNRWKTSSSAANVPFLFKFYISENTTTTMFFRNLIKLPHSISHINVS